jgi:hypothetical protein
MPKSDEPVEPEPDHPHGLSFHLPGSQREAVFALARRDSCSVSAILRQAVAAFLAAPGNAGYLADVQQAAVEADAARAAAQVAAVEEARS